MVFEKAALGLPRSRDIGLALRRMKNIRTGDITCKRCNIEPASCLVGDVAICTTCKQKSVRARMRAR